MGAKANHKQCQVISLGCASDELVDPRDHFPSQFLSPQAHPSFQKCEQAIDKKLVKGAFINAL